MILARENLDYQSWEAPTQPQQRPLTRQAAKKQNNKGRRVYLVVVAMAFLLGILVAAQCTSRAVAGYQLDKQQKQLEALQKENQTLNKQVSQLQSITRIEAIATGKLGMVASQNERFLPASETYKQEQVPARDNAANGKNNTFQGIINALGSIF